MNRDKLEEPWSPKRDAQHPVRWTSAGGDAEAYLTLKGAVERLTKWADGSEDFAASVEQKLLAGKTASTDFAYYRIDPCEACGYRWPQHGENCTAGWTEGELREAYGR